VPTTITLDDDVAVLMEGEHARTGGPFRAVVNRRLRRGARAGGFPTPPPLPGLPGRPILDLSDLSALDEARPAERALS
jgi:hypothetical protein